MATLYLTEQQTLVKKEGDTLVVHIPENKEQNQPKKKVRVPLIKIDRVVVQGNATLTSPAIAALMDRRVEVTFLDQYGRFYGHLAPAFSKNGQLRLAQTAAHHDPVRHHHLTQAFVSGKLQNMRTMLMRANRKRQNEAITNAVQALKQTIDDVAATVIVQTEMDTVFNPTENRYQQKQGYEDRNDNQETKAKTIPSG